MGLTQAWKNLTQKISEEIDTNTVKQMGCATLSEMFPPGAQHIGETACNFVLGVSKEIVIDGVVQTCQKSTDLDGKESHLCTAKSKENI